MAPPRIIYEGDETAAHRHLPVAQNLLHKVRTMAAASGAGATGLSLSPDPDSFIYALKIGETEVLHVFSAPRTSYEPPTFETQTLPDILSGVTRDARLKERIDNDGNTVGTLDTFKPNAETGKKYKRRGFGQWDRLAVRPHTGVSAPTREWVSQYNIVFASAYSGRMTKLVQVLLGFGRLPKHQIVGTPYEIQQRIANGMQVQYDSRWHRCHILATGADGKQWLVEISMGRGVVAMRLPIYPKQPSESTDAMKAVKEEFGGLPTGHVFPSSKLFDKALAEGTIVQLAAPSALSGFYRLQPFSTAMGWATNSKGDEAHNTGFYFGEDGIRRAAHYRLSIRIGALKKNREPGEPIVDADATLSLVSDGRFYHPSELFPPPIKFWEPLIGGLASTDMRATLRAGHVNPDTSVQALPLCDVTMHVCYVDDQLKLIKYFWDRAEIENKPVVTTNYEDCMYIGSWFQEEAYPDPNFVATFYTTDFDHRGQGVGIVTRRDTVGTDLGRWSYSWGVDTGISIAPQWGYLYRHRTFRMRSVASMSEGKRTAAAILAPRGLRDGYVYALHRAQSSTSVTTSTTYKQLRDPNGYQIYQYFYPAYKPTDGCWLQFIYKVHHPIPSGSGGCNEMVDEGPWKVPCDDIESQGPSQPADSSTSKIVKATYTTEPFLVAGGARGTIQLRRLSGDYSASKWEAWSSTSPDKVSGDIQQYVATVSAMGEPHMTYFNQLNGDQIRLGSLIAAEGEADYNFIGVL